MTKKAKTENPFIAMYNQRKIWDKQGLVFDTNFQLNPYIYCCCNCKATLVCSKTSSVIELQSYLLLFTTCLHAHYCWQCFADGCISRSWANVLRCHFYPAVSLCPVLALLAQKMLGTAYCSVEVALPTAAKMVVSLSLIQWARTASGRFLHLTAFLYIYIFFIWFSEVRQRGG